MKEYLERGVKVSSMTCAWLWITLSSITLLKIIEYRTRPHTVYTVYSVA